MDMLRHGLLGQKEMVVEEKDLASVMGNVGADVLSTHCVVLLMELASRNAVEDHLGQGQMIDHILASRALMTYYQAAEIHNEILPDESGAFRTDVKFPESDHAPVVAAFLLP